MQQIDQLCWHIDTQLKHDRKKKEKKKGSKNMAGFKRVRPP